MTEDHPGRLDTFQKAILAMVCLAAGAAPLAARLIPDDVARVACGLVIALAYLAVALFVRQRSALQHFWQLALAFFVLALWGVLNSSIPGFVGTSILHDPPNGGNPLASTVSGTVVIQLLETLIAIVPASSLPWRRGRTWARSTRVEACSVDGYSSPSRSSPSFTCSSPRFRSGPGALRSGCCHPTARSRLIAFWY